MNYEAFSNLTEDQPKVIILHTWEQTEPKVTAPS